MSPPESDQNGIPGETPGRGPRISAGRPQSSLQIVAEPVDMGAEPWLHSATWDGRALRLDRVVPGMMWPARHYLRTMREVRPVVGIKAGPQKRWKYPYEVTTSTGHRHFMLADKPLVEVPVHE